MGEPRISLTIPHDSNHPFQIFLNGNKKTLKLLKLTIMHLIAEFKTLLKLKHGRTNYKQ